MHRDFARQGPADCDHACFLQLARDGYSGHLLAGWLVCATNQPTLNLQTLNETTKGKTK